MTVYIVTGKLGSGKNLAAVGRIRQYLERGLPVATNIDLNLPVLMRGRRKCGIVTRLPDFPSPDDLEGLGAVDNKSNEENNGALVLDECGVLLNAREWGDKGRQRIIDWMLHSRKLGWDVYLIVQSMTLLDKQLREALAELVVTVRRTDRIQIPLFGTLIRWLSGGWLKGKLPRIHVCSVRYGFGPSSAHAETWTFRGDEFFGAYPTKQRFTRHYDAGPYCLLPRDWPGTKAAKPRPRSGPALPPKVPAVERLLSLPPDDRIVAWKELQRAGIV